MLPPADVSLPELPPPSQGTTRLGGSTPSWESVYRALDDLPPQYLHPTVMDALAALIDAVRDLQAAAE